MEEYDEGVHGRLDGPLAQRSGSAREHPQPDEQARAADEEWWRAFRAQAAVAAQEEAAEEAAAWEGSNNTQARHSAVAGRSERMH